MSLQIYFLTENDPKGLMGGQTTALNQQHTTFQDNAQLRNLPTLTVPDNFILIGQTF